RAFTNVGEASRPTLDLSLRGLTDAIAEISAALSSDLEKRIETASRAIRLGHKYHLECAPAWAFAQLRESLAKNSLDLGGADLMAMAYIEQLRHLIAHWRHHPVFPDLAREFLDDYHHAATVFT